MLYLFSFILGAGGAALIAKWAPLFGLIDNPNHRSSHDRPTPKGGGIGILAAFILVSFWMHMSIFLWLPILLVSLVGFYSDKVNISPKVRLYIQFGAAAVVMIGPFDKGHIALFPFWAVFIVGTANCYNFMDGINGIAAISGIIGFLLVGCYIHSLPETNYLIPLAISVILACVAFLPFNVPAAKVFMGDVGSILLGFLYGSVVYIASGTFLDFLCLVSFMFPFYSDEVITKFFQIIDGDKFTRPHRKHFYQLLANEMGVDHWKVSSSYGVLQLIVGISAIGAGYYGVIGVITVLMVYFLIFLWAYVFVRKRVIGKVGR